MNDKKEIAFWGSVACANIWFADGGTIVGAVWLTWAAVILTVAAVRDMKK